VSEIEWEDPPSSYARQPSGAIRAFIETLKEHPGKWAVYKRDAKSSNSTHYTLRHPGTEWTERRNGDGTISVYARWKDDA